jgi:hypothetical protein
LITEGVIARRRVSPSASPAINSAKQSLFTRAAAAEIASSLSAQWQAFKSQVTAPKAIGQSPFPAKARA